MSNKYLEKVAADLTQDQLDTLLQGKRGYVDSSSTESWKGGLTGAAIGAGVGAARLAPISATRPTFSLTPDGRLFVDGTKDVGTKAVGAIRGAKAFGAAGLALGAGLGLAKAYRKNTALDAVKESNPEEYTKAMAFNTKNKLMPSTVGGITHPMTALTAGARLPLLAAAAVPSLVESSLSYNAGKKMSDEVNANDEKTVREARKNGGYRNFMTDEEAFVGAMGDGAPVLYDRNYYAGDDKSGAKAIGGTAISGGVIGAAIPAFHTAKTIGAEAALNKQLYAMGASVPAADFEHHLRALKGKAGKGAAIGLAAGAALGAWSHHGSKKFDTKLNSAGLSPREKLEYLRSIYGRDSDSPAMLTPEQADLHRRVHAQ